MLIYKIYIIIITIFLILYIQYKYIKNNINIGKIPYEIEAKISRFKSRFFVRVQNRAENSNRSLPKYSGFDSYGKENPTLIYRKDGVFRLFFTAL